MVHHAPDWSDFRFFQFYNVLRSQRIINSQQIQSSLRDHTMMKNR